MGSVDVSYILSRIRTGMLPWKAASFPNREGRYYETGGESGMVATFE